MIVRWILAALLACQATPTPAPAPRPAAPPRPAELTGTLVDHTGSPLADALVLACASGYCQDARTRSDGRFRFAVKRPLTVTLKADGVVAGPGRRATALLPGIPCGSGATDAGQLVAPALPPGVRLPGPDEGPRPLEVGDGLALTLDRGALRAPVHTYLHEAAARRLAPERSAPFEDAVGEPVVAVYAVEPFGTTSASPVAVTLPSTLPAGARVRFRTVSAVDGSFSEPVSGRADGGWARTDPGVGIGELSYLVVTEATPP